MLIASYLDVPLRYPLHFGGSCSYVSDCLPSPETVSAASGQQNIPFSWNAKKTPLRHPNPMPFICYIRCAFPTESCIIAAMSPLQCLSDPVSTCKLRLTFISMWMIRIQSSFSELIGVESSGRQAFEWRAVAVFSME